MTLSIRAENVSKCYQIHHDADGGGYRTLRETLMNLTTAPIRRWRNGPAGRQEEFWALKDINFEYRAGDVVGVIGRNGAGKSTLLKILSRITSPTSGVVKLYGRVSSLLEVGTGFHPELTGRENIFLNGSILGMGRKEIARKFDAIVDFAQIERFLDTPVKRYSSGMYVRLAFAVAAHLEPEILLVDEVLAVGDIAFQKKCLGKMGEVAGQGRTIFFVSHNLGSITRLCNRGLYLADGQIAHMGPVDECVGAYVRQLSGADTVIRQQGIEAHVEFLRPDGSKMNAWSYGTPLIVKISVTSARPLTDPAVELNFYAESGAKLFSIQSERINNALGGLTIRHFQMTMELQNPGLACSQVSVDFGIHADGGWPYIMLAHRVETIPISLENTPYECVPDTLVCVPCKIQITDTGSDSRAPSLGAGHAG